MHRSQVCAAQSIQPFNSSRTPTAKMTNLFFAGAFKQSFKDSNLGGAINVKNSSLLTSTPLFKNQGAAIGYPEVTLHPIQSGSNSQKNVNDNLSDAHGSSLLHGILTKVCSVLEVICCSIQTGAFEAKFDFDMFSLEF